MNDTSKPNAQRPPPLPTPRSRREALASVKAFLTIRWIRVEAALRNAWEGMRRRPARTAVVLLALIVAATTGAWLAFGEVPDLAVFSPKTVAEARAAAREHPNDAAAQRELGHKLWAAKRRHAAIQAYARALEVAPSSADDEMATHLVQAFGTRDQHLAEALIWKNGVVAAEKSLKPLVHAKRYAVRWGAVHTLDKLEKGTRANWETAYIVDLDSGECEIRRNAVEKLGHIGSPRAVAALRAAKAQDEKTGGWFKPKCLGDRIDTAEKQILARR